MVDSAFGKFWNVGTALRSQFVSATLTVHHNRDATPLSAKALNASEIYDIFLGQTWLRYDQKHQPF